MKKLILLSFSIIMISCTKTNMAITEVRSCNFTFVFKNYGTSPMICMSDEQIDTIKTSRYQRIENYNINSGLLHGQKQVYISCQSNDSVQVFGYLNGILQVTGFKNKVSKEWITYTW